MMPGSLTVKIKLIILTSIVIIAGLMVLYITKAQAMNCSYIMLGRCSDQHYHNGLDSSDYSGNRTYVFSSSDGTGRTGLNAGSLSTFLSLISTRLNYGGASVTPAQIQDRTGAAFMINSMWGHYGTDFGTVASGLSNAKNIYSSWASLVTDYDSRGCVNWDRSSLWAHPFWNSRYSRASTVADRDDAFYWASSGADSYEFSIVFYYPAAGQTDCNSGTPTTIYKIRKNCGNPAGTLSNLPTLPDEPPASNPVVTPLSSVSATQINVGGTATFTHSIRSEDVGSTYFNVNHQTKQTTATTAQNPSTGLYATATFNVTSSNKNSTRTVNTNTWTPTASDVGKYRCQNLTLSSVTSPGQIGTPNPSNRVCVYVLDGGGGGGTPGCMDPAANNYNPSATVDDGSCTYDTVIYGCMDPAASNYNPSATVDDGSCVYPVYGCTDPAASNYNPSATVDDGSCVYPVYGCTDPAATNYDPSATVDDGSCVYPTFWDYDPQTPTGPADGPYYPKPGNSINITSEVRNIGTGAGPGYEHSIGVWSDYNGYETLTSQNMAGISRGSSRSISGTYTVPSTARNGHRVCFWTENTPVSGQSTPSMTTTVWGPASSNSLCYTIYNLRFDLSTPAIGGMPTSAYPGQIITGIVLTVGNDDPNLSSSYPYATRGIAPSVTITTSGNLVLATPISTTLDLSANEIRQWTNQTVTVPAGAVLGQEYCLILNANKDTGYSDGTGLAGSVQSQACVTINDGPYLKVYGNDALTGGGFNLDNFCPNGEGKINTLRLNNVGAMDQYAAFAKAAITSFGTAGTGGGNLAFANTPSLGNFGEMPCARNLFDDGSGGHPSGEINNDLWDNALISVRDLQDTVGYNDDSLDYDNQYKFSGNQSYNNNRYNASGGNTYAKRQTILIHGDLTISKNITSTSNLGTGANPDVPILIFIVSGNILIDERVERLDGIYIARGYIDTCTNGGVAYDRLASNICNRPLEINGAFIAQNVRFKRTNGGTNQDVTRCTYVPSDDGIPISASGNDLSCTAEIFRFSPEVYIANPILNYGTSNEFKIQQIRDLPPVY